ncbi:MAG: rod shape-determining protein MreD [Patescibacteria group bacterium]|nr:rod shape-determining protein MreD [Patescibacteria group bacterium]MCL5094184.1 rod shape-determining protein MreD [Patescibacteria group bacterium]
MVNFYLFLLALGVFILQVSFFGDIRFFGIIPNFVFVFIFLSALYYEKINILIFLAVLFGFLLDISGSGFFGFNILFFLALVYFIKLVTKEGRAIHLQYIAILVLFSSFLYNLLQAGLNYFKDGIIEPIIFQVYLKQVGVDVAASLLLFFAFGKIFKYFQRLDQKSNQIIS